MKPGQLSYITTNTSFGSSQLGNYSCTANVYSNNYDTIPYWLWLLSGSAELISLFMLFLLLHSCIYCTVTVTAPSSAVENLTAIPTIRSVQFSWLPPSYMKPAAIVENYYITCSYS